MRRKPPPSRSRSPLKRHRKLANRVLSIHQLLPVSSNSSSKQKQKRIREIPSSIFYTLHPLSTIAFIILAHYRLLHSDLAALSLLNSKRTQTTHHLLQQQGNNCPLSLSLSRWSVHNVVSFIVIILPYLNTQYLEPSAWERVCISASSRIFELPPYY